MLKKLLCKLGYHDYEETTETVPLSITIELDGKPAGRIPMDRDVPVSKRCRSCGVLQNLLGDLIPEGFLPIPKHCPNHFNACSTPCDAMRGPCACGATHSLDEHWIKERMHHDGLTKNSNIGGIRKHVGQS